MFSIAAGGWAMITRGTVTIDILEVLHLNEIGLSEKTDFCKFSEELTYRCAFGSSVELYSPSIKTVKIGYLGVVR